MEIGFDSEKFITLQRQAILDRLERFNGVLYMELGGKIFDDLHASRVLPGYNPDNKIKVLQSLKENLEIVLCINANDVGTKFRADFGITYDQEVERLIKNLGKVGLHVSAVCITLFEGQPKARQFGQSLTAQNIDVYFHTPIPDYPHNVPLVCSDQGYGKNPYIKTTKKLVVVAAPGPGSCKMATALSQIYHEGKMGLSSGYAKFETFPVWNLPLDHPVNIAYEASTADLMDENLIDPYHKKAYGIDAVNYNRDIETFPVLKKILDSIMGSSPYNSPTDMGINTVGQCIVNDDVCRVAGAMEVKRRLEKAKQAYADGKIPLKTLKRNEELYELVKNLL